MAENLAKKKRIREGHRTSVTKLIHQVETVLAGELDTLKLSTLRMTPAEKIKTLSTLDDEIASLLEDEEALAEDIEQSDEYKQKIYAIIVSIDKAIALAPSMTPALVATAPPLHGDSLSTDAASRVRLPKLTIRPFDCDITKWTSFWDSYESAIHTNTDLSDVDKFNYLRSLLERTAKDTISGLTLTAANYKEAVEILQKRFGSKHMDILLNLDPVVSASPKALRNLYDRVEANVHGLKSLGVDSRLMAVCFPLC